MKNIFLFCGYKRSGKNTLAAVMHDLLFAKSRVPKAYAFADELRRHMSILNPIVGRKNEHDQLEAIWYNDAIARYGYERAKEEYSEIRRLLQTYGTELVQGEFDNNYWACHLTGIVNADLNESRTDALITDCRFPHEEQWVRAFFCSNPFTPCKYAVHLVRVTRPGTESDGHASEDLSWITSQHRPHVFINDAPTLEEAQVKMREFCELLLKEIGL